LARPDAACGLRRGAGFEEGALEAGGEGLAGGGGAGYAGADDGYAFLWEVGRSTGSAFVQFVCSGLVLVFFSRTYG